jgi:hypothetical protein
VNKPRQKDREASADLLELVSFWTLLDLTRWAGRGPRGNGPTRQINDLARCEPLQIA